VGDIVNPHINDGDESTVPDDGTEDEGVSNESIPRKKPSRQPTNDWDETGITCVFHLNCPPADD
jgi:hypothetical protein